MSTCGDSLPARVTHLIPVSMFRERRAMVWAADPSRKRTSEWESCLHHKRNCCHRWYGCWLARSLLRAHGNWSRQFSQGLFDSSCTIMNSTLSLKHEFSSRPQGQQLVYANA